VTFFVFGQGYSVKIKDLAEKQLTSGLGNLGPTATQMVDIAIECTGLRRVKLFESY